MLGWRLAPHAKPLLALSVLALLVLGPGLGGSGRLTYHEAIWAQVAREALSRHAFWVPTLDGRPWLEKPPLGSWLIVISSWLGGEVTELTARLPSAVAAALLALAIYWLAYGAYGPRIALFAGGIQLTMAWLVMRGRLAESDVPLACILTWAILALDRVRAGRDAWRWVLFGLLGLSVLAKGLGFGAVLFGSVLGITVLWDRDRALAGKLVFVPGWILAALVALPWPLAMAWRYPAAPGLWALHVTDRLAAHPAHFIGEPWWQYAPAVLWQTLPWAPLGLLGARRSWRRARRRPGGLDRLLWAWAVGPALLVSLASARNAHYLIYALPPWSIWSALAARRLEARWRARVVSAGRLRVAAFGSLVALGIGYGLGFACLGPLWDRRGVEWAFYEQAGRITAAPEPLVLLYDDWDRQPYPNPFGPTPHDLAVRLYYLNRPACWRDGLGGLEAHPPATPGAAFTVIARPRDLPGLRRLGSIETLAQGPATRADRTFLLLRVTPAPHRGLTAAGPFLRQ